MTLKVQIHRKILRIEFVEYRVKKYSPTLTSFVDSGRRCFLLREMKILLPSWSNQHSIHILFCSEIFGNLIKN